jgi:hypothetical protein
VGGYKPKKISGAWRDWLVERCREKDFTLRGLVAELGERGLKVDYRSVWAFVHAEKLSHKKNADRGRTGSPRCRARRAQWVRYQDRIDPSRVMTDNMIKLRALMETRPSATKRRCRLEASKARAGRFGGKASIAEFTDLRWVTIEDPSQHYPF